MHNRTRWMILTGLSTIFFTIAAIVTVPQNGGHPNGAVFAATLSAAFFALWATAPRITRAR